MGIGIRMWVPSAYGDCDLSYYLEGMGTGSIVPYPLPSLAYVPSPVHQIQRWLYYFCSNCNDPSFVGKLTWKSNLHKL